jgi:plasmid stability protein
MDNTTTTTASAAQWIGLRLFLGRTQIGSIHPHKTPGPDAGKWAGISNLPGAKMLLGPFDNEATAREMVTKSAQNRVKAMFGAGIDPTHKAVNEGRKLRTTARAIWHAGVWTCDRQVNAHAMFADLGRELGLEPESAPKPNKNGTAQPSNSLEPPTDTGEFIEDYPNTPIPQKRQLK